MNRIYQTRKEGIEMRYESSTPIILLGALLIAVTTSAALGQTTESEETASGARLREARALERYDVDGDGRLDAAERSRLRLDRAARLRQIFAPIQRAHDLDADGQLDRWERERMRRSRERRLERLRGKAVALWDADTDGELDPAERAKMIAAEIETIARLRRVMLESYDRNGDGALDLEEKASLWRSARRGESER